MRVDLIKQFVFTVTVFLVLQSEVGKRFAVAASLTTEQSTSKYQDVSNQYDNNNTTTGKPEVCSVCVVTILTQFHNRCWHGNM